jgi:quercetin dioxygenase-like cupin family protein
MMIRSLAILLTASVFGGCDKSMPSAVPGFLEPHHHVRFENEYVRVMETRLAPGEETLPHSHPIEAAVIFLTDGRMRIEHEDGTSQESSLEANTVAFGAAETVHRAVNIGAETLRVVSIEILTRPPAGFVAGEEHELILRPSDIMLENDKVTMSRFRVAPGGIAHVPNPTAMIVVAVTKGVVVTSDSTTALLTGGVHWCDQGQIELCGDADGVFETIIVSLKPVE